MRTSLRLTCLFIAFGLILSAGTSAAGQAFNGRVIGVTDGDTITVLRDNEPIKIRLLGIDAPERQQAYSAQAKQYASQLVFGKIVTVEFKKKDQWGRILGEVTLLTGQSMNQEMVRAGYSWHFVRYSTDKELARLEEEARSRHRGLWQDVNPVPPWDFRKKAR